MARDWRVRTTCSAMSVRALIAVSVKPCSIDGLWQDTITNRSTVFAKNRTVKAFFLSLSLSLKSFYKYSGFFIADEIRCSKYVPGHEHFQEGRQSYGLESVWLVMWDTNKSRHNFCSDTGKSCINRACKCLWLYTERKNRLFRFMNVGDLVIFIYVFIVNLCLNYLFLTL